MSRLRKPSPRVGLFVARKRLDFDRQVRGRGKRGSLRTENEQRLGRPYGEQLRMRSNVALALMPGPVDRRHDVFLIPKVITNRDRSSSPKLMTAAIDSGDVHEKRRRQSTSELLADVVMLQHFGRPS